MPKFTVEVEKSQITKSVVAIEIEAEDEGQAVTLVSDSANDGDYDKALTVISIRSSYEVDFCEELEN